MAKTQITQEKNERICNLFSRLEFILKERDISIPELATAIKVAASSIYRWEKGSSPRAKQLEAVAKYLCVNANWLLLGEGEMWVKVATTQGEESFRVSEEPNPYHAEVDRQLAGGIGGAAASSTDRDLAELARRFIHEWEKADALMRRGHADQILAFAKEIYKRSQQPTTAYYSS